MWELSPRTPASHPEPKAHANGLSHTSVPQVDLLTAINIFSPQGLISIPAPCQYAHKLTFLVAQSIHKEPSLELSNSLFYL